MAVRNGDRLVGFFDRDTAGPSTREFDLAFAALWWVPLCPPSVADGLGFHHSADRSRRLHLLLDAYGYDGDRHAFGATIVRRARRQTTVMREMAEAGDRAVRPPRRSTSVKHRVVADLADRHPTIPGPRPAPPSGSPSRLANPSRANPSVVEPAGLVEVVRDGESRLSGVDLRR